MSCDSTLVSHLARDDSHRADRDAQGPTSAYRAVLADCVKGQALLDFEALPDPNEEAARKWSLTRAPIPGAMPADPTVPTRPPVLAPEFTVRIVQSAFQYCFSHFNVLDER